jgi:hypothetical protein
MCGLAVQSVAAGRRSLDAAASSPEELVRRFLDLVAGNNVDQIRRLAVNEEEFSLLLYPETPAADPRRNTSAEFVWNMHHIRSESSLERMIHAIGGRRLELEELRFTGGTTEYETYRVHRDSLLVLRDENGEQQRVRLFGSVLELDNQFKIFSFIND